MSYGSSSQQPRTSEYWRNHYRNNPRPKTNQNSSGSYSKPVQLEVNRKPPLSRFSSSSNLISDDSDDDNPSSKPAPSVKAPLPPIASAKFQMKQIRKPSIPNPPSVLSKSRTGLAWQEPEESGDEFDEGGFDDAALMDLEIPSSSPAPASQTQGSQVSGYEGGGGSVTASGNSSVTGGLGLGYATGNWAHRGMSGVVGGESVAMSSGKTVDGNPKGKGLATESSEESIEILPQPRSIDTSARSKLSKFAFNPNQPTSQSSPDQPGPVISSQSSPTPIRSATSIPENKVEKPGKRTLLGIKPIQGNSFYSAGASTKQAPTPPSWKSSISSTNNTNPTSKDIKPELGMNRSQTKPQRPHPYAPPQNQNQNQNQSSRTSSPSSRSSIKSEDKVSARLDTSSSSSTSFGKPQPSLSAFGLLARKSDGFGVSGGDDMDTDLDYLINEAETEGGSGLGNSNATAGPSTLKGKAAATAIDLDEDADGLKIKEGVVKVDVDAEAEKHPAVVVLSKEQQKVLEMVLAGQSLFFTGSAGTGKSVLLREMIRQLRSKDRKDPKTGAKRKTVVAVTAPTGIAAVNIGGQTIHSWSGGGLFQDEAVKIAHKIVAKSKKAEQASGNGKKSSGMHSFFGKGSGSSPTASVSEGTPLERWVNTDVLVVDEVSMLDGRMLDKLEYLGKRLRSDQRPFGGIQLVLCGDFFQLPPVPDKGISAFAFQAVCWKACIPRMITLSKVFRQDDQTFVNMLNEARLGQLTPQTIKRFAALARPISYSDGIAPTELFPVLAQVDNVNRARLAALPGKPQSFVSSDIPGRRPDGTSYNHHDAVKLLDKNCRAVPCLDLKVGAQVMCVANLTKTLCNGSIGKVIAFESILAAANKGITSSQKTEKEGQQEKPKPKYEMKPDTRDQDVFMGEDDEEDFEILGARPTTPASQPDGVVEEDGGAKLATRTDADLPGRPKWPVVEFANGQTMLMTPQDFEIVAPGDVVEARRIQVPLILAWALSMHKSQGLTISRLKIDLDRVFEKGQAYVALSRATSTDTLQVLNFKPHKVLAHPAVIEWSRTLQNAGR